VDSASRALRDTARQLLPDATFASVEVTAFSDGTRDLRPFQVVDNEHGYFVAFAQITRDNGANGLFTLAMWPGPDSWKAPTMDCDRPAGDGHVCETRTGPGGERLVIERGRWVDTDITEFQVKLRRPDGTLLVARANDDAQATAQDGPSPAPRSAGPPLTTDQLIALLETPGLGVPAPHTQPG
jgi:hypothetical protein